MEIEIEMMEMEMMDGDREMIISLYRSLFICVSIFIYKILLDM